MSNPLVEALESGASCAPLRFGVPIHKACDACGRAIKLVPLVSGNTLGATLWSDGYLDAPQLPQQSLLGACRGCGAILYLPDLAPYGDCDALSALEDYSALPLMPEDMEGLIDRIGDVAEEVHLYLRLTYWQMMNMERRYDTPWKPLSGAERANLRALLGLLGTDDADRLLKAEVLRELGRYDEAAEVLSESFDDAASPIVTRLLLLAGTRQPIVTKVLSGNATDPGSHRR